MDRTRVILKCAGIGILIATGYVLAKYVVESMLVVVATFEGLPLVDAGLSWLVVFFGPAIMAVVFVQVIKELPKLLNVITGDDIDSKVDALEKRIRELEKDKVGK